MYIYVAVANSKDDSSREQAVCQMIKYMFEEFLFSFLFYFIPLAEYQQFHQTRLPTTP